MSKIGERLIASAKQAREIAQGRVKPAGVFVPPDVDVKPDFCDLECIAAWCRDMAEAVTRKPQ